MTQGHENDGTSEVVDKGPTEQLREQAKPDEERLVPGGEVPGAQNPDSEEIKDEKNLNTE